MLETIKALGQRPRAFTCFSVSGSPDETLALLFDILLEEQCTENHPQYLSRLTRALFPTNFLEIAVYEVEFEILRGDWRDALTEYRVQSSHLSQM